MAAPLDSDGDGVPDDRDQCPNTPAGVAVDEVGCPLDSDGDGVPDYRDKCPGTPLGTKVDADGCAIIESMVIDLNVEEFDFGSAELRPPMKDALDNLADTILRSRGEETITIVGHTDSVGPAEYNQGLSQRRAQSAADHLISRGVDTDRVTVKGEGETSPIADNDTDAGRARNRRIEVKTR
jgi:OOP family OmpA-OmpF porin